MEYTKETIARHEAAHFVVDWAIGQPSIQSIVYPKPKPDGTAGFTSGGPMQKFSYEAIISALAGPMADHWELDDEQIVEVNKEVTDDVLDSIRNQTAYEYHDCDWAHCLNVLAQLGVDILDPATLKAEILRHLAVVRAILKRCKAEWGEAYEILFEHGHIGYLRNGMCDQGEEAEQLFERWGDYTLDEPIAKVKDIVGKYDAPATFNHGPASS